MGLFRKKKEPALSRRESLDAVIEVNQTIAVTREEGGCVTLHIPFEPPPAIKKIAAFLGAKETPRTTPIELDEIGTFCWDLFDGTHPVREIIGRLAERYKLNRKEAEVALTSFIRTLAGKGLVIIVVPSRADGPRR